MVNGPQKLPSLDRVAVVFFAAAGGDEIATTSVRTGFAMTDNGHMSSEDRISNADVNRD